jgi:FkbM family methyltransferase
MATLRSILSPRMAYTAEHFFPKKRTHRRRMIEHYHQFIKPGDLVFDVGANLGERTKIFRLIGAKVIAIEPQKYCVNYLRGLFSADNNVIVVDKALGENERSGEININEKFSVISTMSDKWKTQSRFAKDYQWTKKETIQLTTLDKLIQQYGLPSFCKIDVEGYELNVFKGLSKKIPLLSFEFMKEFFNDAILCLNKLSQIGKIEVNYTVGESMNFTLKKWVEISELEKSINSTSDPTLWGDIYVRGV